MLRRHIANTNMIKKDKGIKRTIAEKVLQQFEPGMLPRKTKVLPMHHTRMSQEKMPSKKQTFHTEDVTPEDAQQQHRMPLNNNITVISTVSYTNEKLGKNRFFNRCVSQMTQDEPEWQ